VSRRLVPVVTPVGGCGVGGVGVGVGGMVAAVALGAGAGGLVLRRRADDG